MSEFDYTIKNPYANMGNPYDIYYQNVPQQDLGSDIDPDNPETWFIPDDDYEDSGISTFESGLRGLGQGATFGFEDELRGGILGGYDALTSDESFSDAYTTRRDEIRALNEQAREANTGAYMGGELIGGIASGIAAAPLTGGASFAGGAARMARTLGAQGALAGLGYSEAEDLGGMAQSAAIGGTLGAVGGTVTAYGMKAVGNQIGRMTIPEKLAQGAGKIGQKLVEGAEKTAGKRLIRDPVPEMVIDNERIARLGRWAMNNKALNNASTQEELQRNVVKRTDEVYDMMLSPDNPFHDVLKNASVSKNKLETIQDEVSGKLERLYGNRFDYEQFRDPITKVSNRVKTITESRNDNSRYHTTGLIKLQKELARNIDFSNTNPSPEEIVFRNFYTKYNDVITDSAEIKDLTRFFRNAFENARDDVNLSPEVKQRAADNYHHYMDTVRENADTLTTALDTMTAGSIASRAPSAGETLVGQTAASIGGGIAGTGLGYLSGSGLGSLFPEYQNELQTIGTVVGGALGGVTGAASDKIAGATGRLANNAVSNVSIRGRDALGKALGGTPRKSVDTITQSPPPPPPPPSKLRELYGKFAGVLESAKERGQHNFAITYQALYNQNEEFRKLVRNSTENE